MIYTLPGEDFEAFLFGAPEGLVGTLSFRMTDPPAGTVIVAETTAGITEAAPGIYTRTQAAPDTQGTYLIVWEHGSTTVGEDVTVTASLPGGGVPSGETRPTTADVAAVLRTRTKHRMAYREDFSETDTPTKSTVETLITLASGLILPGMGDLSDDVLACTDAEGVRDGVKSLVTLAAAMLVEASYWPEQQGQGEQTVARLMQDLIEGDHYDRIARAASRCRGEVGGGDEDAPSSIGVAYAFPEDRGGMVGWQSRW